ncbi:MAG: hypothetical protein ACK46W_08640, partial [Bacteroidota bacterium]
MRCFVISIFIWIIWARPYGSGYSGLAKARLLLRNELNPAYPYRIFLVELFLVRCFVISFFIWIILARPFGSGYSGLAKARLFVRIELNPAYPYR